MRALLFIIAVTLQASPTHIVDVLYQPNGNPPAVAAGTDITISQTAFVSGNNYYPAFSLSPHPVSDAGGNIDLWLEPNPLGQPYTILYRATNGVLTHEFWTVPIGRSVLKIKDVITSVGPSPPLGFVQLSQLAAGGASLNQVLSFNGTQWVPASLSTLGLEVTANKDQANGYAGLTAGTFLKAAEFPNFTGDCTSSAGTVSLNCSTIHLGGTAHGVVIGQAGSPVTVTGPGTAGQVLTSNGPSADPTYQPAGGGTLTQTASFIDVPAYGLLTVATIGRASGLIYCMDFNIDAPKTVSTLYNYLDGTVAAHFYGAAIYDSSGNRLTAATSTGTSTAVATVVSVALGGGSIILTPGTSGRFGLCYTSDAGTGFTMFATNNDLNFYGIQPSGAGAVHYLAANTASFGGSTITWPTTLGAKTALGNPSGIDAPPIGRLVP